MTYYWRKTWPNGKKWTAYLKQWHKLSLNQLRKLGQFFTATQCYPRCYRRYSEKFRSVFVFDSRIYLKVLYCFKIQIRPTFSGYWVRVKEIKNNIFHIIFYRIVWRMSLLLFWGKKQKLSMSCRFQLKRHKFYGNWEESERTRMINNMNLLLLCIYKTYVSQVNLNFTFSLQS